MNTSMLHDISGIFTHLGLGPNQQQQQPPQQHYPQQYYPYPLPHYPYQQQHHHDPNQQN
jgi:hypothetical protein